MSIQINRFEKREIKKHGTVQIENMNTILIKDHTTDNIISMIQLENDKKKNKELADRIILAIEEYIMEQSEE